MQEYTVIDQATDLIYGPYATRKQADSVAEDFEAYEIFHGDKLVDWRSAKTDTEIVRAAFRRAHRDPKFRALLISFARAQE